MNGASPSLPKQIIDPSQKIAMEVTPDRLIIHGSEVAVGIICSRTLNHTGQLTHIMTNSVQTPKNRSLDDENISSLFTTNSHTTKSQSPTQASFEPFSFDGQRDTKDFGLSWSAPFPAAIKVTNAATIPQAVSLVHTFTHSGQLHELVKRHGGAIVIRGLPLKTASDYSKVAHAFGLQPHVEVGRPPLRTVLAPNVKTANEGPPELPIWPHNEYGWSTINPAWLTFSALEIPTEGGATPITSSIYIAHRLSTLVPEFVEKLQKLGVRYTYRYTVNRVVSNTGASIREAYGAHIQDEDDQHTARQKIEAEVKRHSNNFEWHDDGSLSVTHVVPG